MKDLRIGLTMRETKALEYIETRDSVSRDWMKYLNKCIPQASFIILPNLGIDIIKYIKEWKLNGFILSGGDDYGKSKERDLTEKKIFDFAQINNYPILGVCRGAQIIFKFMGGSFKKGIANDINYHSNNRHLIKFKNKKHKVNSYHSNILIEKTTPKNLVITSKCLNDNTIESFEGKNILGFMWHPEREKDFSNFDLNEIKKLFKYE